MKLSTGAQEAIRRSGMITMARSHRQDVGMVLIKKTTRFGGFFYA
jgi:hypothetical protein